MELEDGEIREDAPAPASENTYPGHHANALTAHPGANPASGQALVRHSGAPAQQSNFTIIPYYHPQYFNGSTVPSGAYSGPPDARDFFAYQGGVGDEQETGPQHSLQRLLPAPVSEKDRQALLYFLLPDEAPDTTSDGSAVLHSPPTGSANGVRGVVEQPYPNNPDASSSGAAASGSTSALPQLASLETSMSTAPADSTARDPSDSPLPAPAPRKGTPLFLPSSSAEPSPPAQPPLDQPPSRSRSPSVQSDDSGPIPRGPLFDADWRKTSRRYASEPASEAANDDADELAPRVSRTASKARKGRIVRSPGSEDRSEDEQPRPRLTAKKPVLAGASKSSAPLTAKKPKLFASTAEAPSGARKLKPTASSSRLEEQPARRNGAPLTAKKPVLPPRNGGGDAAPARADAKDKGKGKAAPLVSSKRPATNGASASRAKAGPKSKVQARGEIIEITDSDDADESDAVSAPARQLQRRNLDAAGAQPRRINKRPRVLTESEYEESDVQLVGPPRRPRAPPPGRSQVYVLLSPLSPAVRKRLKTAPSRSPSSDIEIVSPAAGPPSSFHQPTSPPPTASSSRHPMRDSPSPSPAPPRKDKGKARAHYEPFDNSTAESLSRTLNAAFNVAYAQGINLADDSASDSEDDVPLAKSRAPPPAPPKPRPRPRSQSTHLAPNPPAAPPPPSSVPRLAYSASAPAPNHARTPAEQCCIPCTRAGETRCVPAQAPFHRRCTRCHELGIRCARKRVEDRSSSRAPSTLPDAAQGTASASTSVAARASTASGSTLAAAGATAGPSRGLKRAHSGTESAAKKLKVAKKPVASSSLSKTDASAAAADAPSARYFFAMDTDIFNDAGDDTFVPLPVPSDAARIPLDSVTNEGFTRPSLAARSRWLLKGVRAGSLAEKDAKGPKLQPETGPWAASRGWPPSQDSDDEELDDYGRGLFKYGSSADAQALENGAGRPRGQGGAGGERGQQAQGSSSKGKERQRDDDALRDAATPAAADPSPLDDLAALRAQAEAQFLAAREQYVSEPGFQQYINLSSPPPQPRELDLAQHAPPAAEYERRSSQVPAPEPWDGQDASAWIGGGGGAELSGIQVDGLYASGPGFHPDGPMMGGGWDEEGVVSQPSLPPGPSSLADASTADDVHASPGNDTATVAHNSIISISSGSNGAPAGGTDDSSTMLDGEQPAVPQTIDPSLMHSGARFHTKGSSVRVAFEDSESSSGSEPESDSSEDDPSDDDLYVEKGRRAAPQTRRKPAPARTRTGGGSSQPAPAPKPSQSASASTSFMSRAELQKIDWIEVDDEVYCHQCRRKTRLRRAVCTNPSDRPRRGADPGDAGFCGAIYCERCLLGRYGDRYSSQDYTTGAEFSCPRCSDSCNCTACVKKRGEVYQSSLSVGRGTVSGQRNQPSRSLDFGPQSVLAKRGRAQASEQAPAPTLPRIRLLPPKPPAPPKPPKPSKARKPREEPAPAEPWVPAKVTIAWIPDHQETIYGADGYPCGYMTINAAGECMHTYTRDVVVPGRDADGRIYWNEDELESASSSDEDEEEEDADEEDGAAGPGTRSPGSTRTRRKRLYIGTRDLTVLKTLWYPHGRILLMGELYSDAVSYETPGAFVGKRPPRVRDGEMSAELIAKLEAYVFPDEEPAVEQAASARADQHELPPFGALDFEADMAGPSGSSDTVVAAEPANAVSARDEASSLTKPDETGEQAEGGGMEGWSPMFDERETSTLFHSLGGGLSALPVV